MKNLSKKNYSKKMETIQESEKKQQEKGHESASSPELLGTTLCLFMVFKIWQMNT